VRAALVAALHRWALAGLALLRLAGADNRLLLLCGRSGTTVPVQSAGLLALGGPAATRQTLVGGACAAAALRRRGSSGVGATLVCGAGLLALGGPAAALLALVGGARAASALRLRSRYLVGLGTVVCGAGLRALGSPAATWLALLRLACAVGLGVLSVGCHRRQL